MPRSPSPGYRDRDRRYRDDPPRRYRDDGRDGRGYHDDYGRDSRGGGGGYRDSRGDYRSRHWDDRDGRDRFGDRPFIRSTPIHSRDSRDSRDGRDGRDTSPGYQRSPYRPASSGHSSGQRDKERESPNRPNDNTTTPSIRSGTPEEGQITSPNLPTTSSSSTAKLPNRPIPLSPGYNRRRSPSSPPPAPRNWSDRPFRRDNRDWRDWRDSRGWEGGRDRDWRGGGGYRYDDRDRDRRFSRSPPPPPSHLSNLPPRSYSRRSRSPSSISSRSRSSRYTSPTKRSPEKRERDSSPPGRYTPDRSRFDGDRIKESRASPFRDVKPSAFARPPPTAPSGPRSDRAPPTGPKALTGGYIRPNPPPPPPVAPSASSTSTNTPIPATVKMEPQSSEDRVNPYKPPAPNTGRLSWSERRTVTPQIDTKPTLPSIPSTSQEQIKVEQPAVHVKVEEEESKVPLPPPVETHQDDVEMVVEERKVNEDEMKIYMEIASIPTKYGLGQWELDLDTHYAHIQALTKQTNMAQSGMRIAAAILADAEAERVVMGERRKHAEKMLSEDDQYNMGILGVPKI